jgi:hypothetical protein
MVAHLPGVRLQTRPSNIVIRSFLRVEERFERRFRIDHDLFAPGEPDDDIGAKTTGISEE